MHLPILLACCLVASLAAGEAKSDYGSIKPERAAVIGNQPAGMVEGPTPMPWRLFVPKGAVAARPLPLVVFLHGAGRRGVDNVGPMELAWTFISDEAQARHPCFVLAPQVRPAHRWVDQNFNLGSYSSATVQITPEMAAALALTDQTIAAHPIDRTRVYVVGQSMGGYGAWDALVRRPDLWAAAIPICGAGDPAKAESIKTIPVWAWHGENDTIVPVSGSRQMIEALTRAGARPSYNEIAKGGHGVWIPAFEEPKLYDWLFAQRRP